MWLVSCYVFYSNIRFSARTYCTKVTELCRVSLVDEAAINDVPTGRAGTTALFVVSGFDWTVSPIVTLVPAATIDQFLSTICIVSIKSVLAPSMNARLDPECLIVMLLGGKPIKDIAAKELC